MNALQAATAERMAREEQARTGTLADAWEDEPVKTPERRRAYMAGALAAMTLERSGVPREQLIAECVQFGRAVGTKAERATS